MKAIFLFALATSMATASAINVVFILADDFGYGELGCYGQQKIRTPNIRHPDPAQRVLQNEDPGRDSIGLHPVPRSGRQFCCMSWKIR